MIDILGYVICVLAVTGVVFNNRHIIWCFPIWLVSNSLSAGVHAHAGMWGLMIRDIIFIGLAIEGYLIWKRKSHR